MRSIPIIAVAALGIAGCGGDAPPMPAARVAGVSSTLAIAADDRSLWVVNVDSDSVSLVDLVSRKLVAEVPLGSAPPSVDAISHRYDPRVRPRSLALLPGDRKLYVAGESSNRVYVVDVATRVVTSSIPVPAAPTAVIAAPDGSAVYVVSHEAAIVSRIDPTKDVVIASLPVPSHPWGVTVSSDGARLYVSHLLAGAGVTVVDAVRMAVVSTLALADEPDSTNPLRPNGQARGVYCVVPRPVDGALWLPHLLLATHTPQPALDFQSTVFPTVTIVSPDGAAAQRRLLFKPRDVPGAQGAFFDSVSGPRALAFTPDGKLALLALAQSENVMVFDGATGNEVVLVRPVPGTFLEGIIVDHAGKHAYLDGRGSHDVSVLAIDPANALAPVAVDGAPIDRLVSDPMPAELRLGQRLFYSANSSPEKGFPITKDSWVACSTCHLEGGTDAVTWRFKQGPRDTPSNAGGPINTGFLFRQAVRNDVVQYDKTINVEQGGAFDRNSAAQKPQLDALAAFVNYAIPLPQNPNLAADGTLSDGQKRGKTLFDARCASCHAGAFYTDSGGGNPTLDLAGPILLHDVGTCVTTGDFVDNPAADDVTGTMRDACMFDTPTLRGVFATAPYFHDGSAATLRDVVDRLPQSSSLSAAEKTDLVAYVSTL